MPVKVPRRSGRVRHVRTCQRLSTNPGLPLIVLLVLSMRQCQAFQQFAWRKQGLESCGTALPTRVRTRLRESCTGSSGDRTNRQSLGGPTLVHSADAILRDVAQSPSIQITDEIDDNKRQGGRTLDVSSTQSSRRFLFASALMAAGAALGGTATSAEAKVASPGDVWNANSQLPWQVTPVNKRTGVTVYDAEAAGYNVRFVTYLSRFLLCFDADCQRWWYTRASDIPRTATADEVTSARLRQFAAFSASVEVGLQEYRGMAGSKTLLKSLLDRYAPDPQEVFARRDAAGAPDMSEQAKAKQEREIKEARRQIALLFGLLQENQPTEELTKLLAAIDNGSIGKVKIVDPGSGYAPGYGAPEVRFPPPEAGEGYERATGRAVLKPNGRILRLDVVNRGNGYSKPPVVTIAPPAVLRFDGDSDFGRQAEGKAVLFRSGPNKGRIERVDLTNPGAGYSSKEIIRVRFSSPETSPREGGVMATATAVLEYEVSDILVVKNGTGYAVEKPIEVYVDPPPLTARVNMNDPLMARIISPNDLLPPTTIPSPEMRKKMPDPSDPSSLVAQITAEAGRGGGGGCLGRACYDGAVVAVAYPRAEKDVFSTFRNEDESNKASKIESALDMRSSKAVGEPVQPYISASSSLGETPGLLNIGRSGTSSSSQLLSLLPSGIGLEFDSEKGRYILAVDPNFVDNSPLESYKIDPDFGPRGRSPIERDMELGVGIYLRFVLSGAICCSGVHLALTPIDVVKTKVQTDPERYPGVIRSFSRVLKEEGAAGFFQGWVPTFVGFFTWGGVSYSLTEYLRRTGTQLAGSEAANLEVPIILLAAGTAAVVGSFILCPFEAVRIRSVAQPDYAPSILQVLARMAKEEGIPSLFSAIPAFIAKEVPFNCAKFTVFDLSTAWLFDQFPAAREDLQLSLLFSVLGGSLGGVAAAFVSNPADVTISEMKKSKSSLKPLEAAQLVLDRGGPPGLFRGLPLRMIFYTLVVSLQFLVYDSIRFALGVGSDDLKLYLNVLGGALQGKGGPV